MGKMKHRWHRYKAGRSAYDFFHCSNCICQDGRLDPDYCANQDNIMMEMSEILLLQAVGFNVGIGKLFLDDE